MNKKAGELFLAEPFKSAWQNRNVFDEVLALSNSAAPQKIYRNKEGRRTLQFEFAGKSYFLKHHGGVGWREIIKNLAQLRLPVLGASNEFRAAKKLRDLGVDTLVPVAYGCRGSNPATQESFLITEDLVNTISLEDYCRKWPTSPPAFRIKNTLLKKVASSAKVMHANGINHRDFYICHFLLDTKNLLEKNAETKIHQQQNFHCYLIDLHRCQMRHAVPRRWQVKDLGGLLYSSMDIGLSARDYFRFIKIYTGKSLRESLHDSLWRDCLYGAIRLYRKDFGKEPPVLFLGTR